MSYHILSMYYSNSFINFTYKVAAIFLRDRDMRRLMYVADTADWVPLHAAGIYGHLEVRK